MTPQQAYNYAINIAKGPTPQNEHIIAQDAYYAYLYAMDILNERFRQAEQIIAQDQVWAYCYARDVLKGRFQLAEQIITQLQKYLCILSATKDGEFEAHTENVLDRRPIKRYVALTVPHTHANHHIANRRESNHETIG